MDLITENKTNLKYILIVLILAVLVAGGILAYQYWWLPKHEIKPPEITEPETCEDLCGDGTCQEIVCMAIGCPCAETKESCPQDCVGEIDTSNWQTYRNEEYGFEVKYPQGWKFKAISDQITQFGTNEEFLGVYHTPPNHIQVYQSVNDLLNNDQGLDFNSWINKQIANGLFYDKKTIIISDIQGVEVIDRGIINFRNILVKKGEYIYSIVVNQDHSQMNIFDQILSTFKFTP